jgi:stage II sporulation protein AB (anti-sigma F factor)
MMKKKINEMKLRLPAISINEAVARSVISAFCAELNPTVEELGDLRCAVSEAVTNCIVHAYKDSVGIIYITVKLCEGRTVRIEIRDRGRGIENVRLARQPLYTTNAENERSGMGFTVMESFCDRVRVNSQCKKGTTVTLYKLLKNRD